MVCGNGSSGTARSPSDYITKEVLQDPVFSPANVRGRGKKLTVQYYCLATAEPLLVFIPMLASMAKIREVMGIVNWVSIVFLFTLVPAFLLTRVPLWPPAALLA